MKDEFGLNYKTTNPEFAKNAGTATKANVAALLDTLKAHKILPIARIVVFKDSVTARVHPEWTIRRNDGSIWRDKKGLAWVNPYHHELWDYNIGVAEELVKMGFGEVQFDYIRFPEPYPSLPQQVFPERTTCPSRTRSPRISRKPRTRINKLGVRSTADIFGLVTTVADRSRWDSTGRRSRRSVDVVLPMVYPSHYPHGDLGINRPNAEPYKVDLTRDLDGARARQEARHHDAGARASVAPGVHARQAGVRRRADRGAEEGGVRRPGTTAG